MGADHEQAGRNALEVFRPEIEPGTDRDGPVAPSELVHLPDTFR